MNKQKLLRLAALDFEDLQVISAHVQDAIVKVADMAYMPQTHRFAMMVSRFNWEQAGPEKKRRRKTYERRRAILNFDRVSSVKALHLSQRDSDTALELLAIDFTEAKPPAGRITLVFAGGSAVRMDVECIEVQLEDLGAAWTTKYAPDHPLDDGPADLQNNTDT